MTDDGVKDGARVSIGRRAGTNNLIVVDGRTGLVEIKSILFFVVAGFDFLE